MKWVWRRILVYDLSKKKSRSVELDAKVYRRLYGGRGLAAYLLYTMTQKGEPEALGPENPLIVAPGLLLGTGLSTASKTIIAARSPLTGLVGRSSVGARLGWQLRRSRYDALVVTGRLEEPGILVVDEGGAYTLRAEKLWGLRVSEAYRVLRSMLPGYEYCVIGPAGENLSRISLIDCNGRQAGRTGLGAVMGSKRLKAIAVKGFVDPEPAYPEQLRRHVREWAVKLPAHPSSKPLVEYGTPAILEYTNRVHGVFPSLNWRRSTLDWCRDPGRAHREMAYWAPERRVSRNPCPFCNRVCSQVVEAEAPGEGRVRVDGPEYETVYALGADIGVCSIDKIAVLNYYADEYGLDTISLGATIAWAIEATEKGDLGEEYLEGIRLEWGAGLESLVELVRRIAYREGRIGSLLADGAAAAVSRLGRGGEYAIHSKGLELPAYDGRGLKGMALGYAVSSRGGDHLTSGAYAVELPGKLWVYEGIDARSTRAKGLLVKEMEDLMAVYDITGVCKFSRYVLTPEVLAPVVEAAIGEEVGGGDLLVAGERTVVLERLINTNWGLSASQDTLPPRLLREPIPSGPCQGCRVTVEELEEMKREYYAARGLDPDTGEPRRVKLVELGLDEILDSNIST